MMTSTTATRAAMTVHAVDMWRTYGTSSEIQVDALAGVSIGLAAQRFTAVMGQYGSVSPR